MAVVGQSATANKQNKSTMTHKANAFFIAFLLPQIELHRIFMLSRVLVIVPKTLLQLFHFLFRPHWALEREEMENRILRFTSLAFHFSHLVVSPRDFDLRLTQ